MRTWIDNTTLHGAGRSLARAASSQHDLRNLLIFSNLLLFAPSVGINTTDDREGVVAETERFAETLSKLGVPKEFMEKKHFSQSTFFGICDRVAEIAAMGKMLRAGQTGTISNILSDTPTNATHDHDLLSQIIDSNDEVFLNEVAQAAVEKQAGGAIEYILTQGANLRSLIREFIGGGGAWGPAVSFQLSVYLRSLINIELGKEVGSLYFPASSRAQIISQIDDQIASLANKLISEEIAPLSRSTIKLPPASIALVQKANGSPERLFESALRYRERLTSSRELLAEIVSGRTDEAPDNAYINSNLLETDLRGEIQEAIGLKRPSGFWDAITLSWPLGVNTGGLLGASRDLFMKGRVYGITDLARDAARSHIHNDDFKVLERNSGWKGRA